jgi:uncharacterized repeat protein (TIGR03803 family)
VLHNFTGGSNGANPYVGLTLDRAGNLYGTTLYGGRSGAGTVYKLSPHGSSWVFATLYEFSGGNDGGFPASRVAIGSDGTLYGTANLDGGFSGVVFKLQPPPHFSPRILSPWTETVLFTFGNDNGAAPQGDLIFDATGAIYGTTIVTACCYGTVYKLNPSGSGWTQSVLYQFTDPNVGLPLAGVIFDQAGNLYGTTSNHSGAVFELTPSGSGWSEQTLHEFSGGTDGYVPYGGLIFDANGNLYGTTFEGGGGSGCGSAGCGTVFELTPSGGGWTESVPFSFSYADGVAPMDSLVIDSSGNFYGTASDGGRHSYGTVFKLTPGSGGLTETHLYDFFGGNDGASPYGNVILDANGNLYGTTYAGGAYGYGVVFEITP